MLLLHCDPELTLPSRKKVKKGIISNLAKSYFDTLTKSIRPAPDAYILFDLWLSNGAPDIFSIMSRSISQSLEKECYHLGLFKMGGSEGENLAATVKLSLGKHRSRTRFWRMFLMEAEICEMP